MRKHHVARCSGCNDIVELPSARTRSVTCEKCLAVARARSLANQGRTHHVSSVLTQKHLSMCAVEMAFGYRAPPSSEPNGVYEASVGKWREEDDDGE